jgi:hypothetical protein
MNVNGGGFFLFLKKIRQIHIFLMEKIVKKYPFLGRMSIFCGSKGIFWWDIR